MTAFENGCTLSFSSQHKRLEELCRLGRQARDEFDPKKASMYFEQAIKLNPNNAFLYHQLGMLYIDCGDTEKAHFVLLKSIELAPNENIDNYFYIGQQCFGMHAKSAFEKGIALLQQMNKEMKEEIAHKISNAYVSIAELFMTDLCDVQNADKECEKYCHLSLKMWENNIQAIACLAELKLLQKEKSQSKKYFGICIHKIFNQCSNENKSGKQLEKDFTLDENCLNIDSHLKIVKLGIELEEYAPCLKILNGILLCNDSIGDAWALGSIIHWKMQNLNQCTIWYTNASQIAQLNTDDTHLQELMGIVQQNVNVKIIAKYQLPKQS